MRPVQIVVVGGGWAGCAAAWAAAQTGAQVILLERTDLLLGTGLVGGILRNNGRFTAAEELIVLGAESFIDLMESRLRHRAVDFPGHRHAALYDVTRIEPALRRGLWTMGIEVRLQNRVTAVEKEGNALVAVVTERGEKIRGDAFIDATGTAGPRHNCTRYGFGCVMCILRCPTFGPRVSLTAAAGISELRAGEGFPHFEAVSGSCKLDKASLSEEIVRQLEEKGVLIVPLPPEIQKVEMLARKACQQYNLPEFGANLILLDTGAAKLMAPYLPLEYLRALPGFETARYADPYSGGRGNSIRFMAVAPCDATLQVKGLVNLFCAGEKTGLLVGHTEAVATGFLAGYNAVRVACGLSPVSYPTELAVGDIISFMHRSMQSEEGLRQKYTFSGAVYFQRMCEFGLYTTDREEIRRRVKQAGVEKMFLSPKI